ncbi:type II toxin-antitoxin system RelE/ParE family toxin [Persicirhabdus sediminis]|uniref:Type II toxin-antitoxin system RelE/ParE family toxin n=1 Tax=Persicirhabdus sediminis TaxID=454144 RepID=A0A8J7MDR5_9BACT|nr:type II toxin-antitoxin system RelE/ParE family toxin [Persicirhabdus sediminis]
MAELDAIADYIALDRPSAASNLIKEVFSRVSLLEDFPEMCPHPHDLPGTRYSHLSIPPLRVFYRIEGEIVYIVYVMRAERLLRLENLEAK